MIRVTQSTEQTSHLTLLMLGKLSPKAGKTHLVGLVKFLAPGTVVKYTAFTSNIMEPRRPAVRDKNCDLAKFCVKEERSIPLSIFLIRRPDYGTSKSTEKRQVVHATELKKGKNDDFLVKRRNQGNIEVSRKTKLSNLQRAL